MQRPGFTILEIILALGMLSMAAALAVPAYRQLMIRTDFNLAQSTAMQGIERARFLASVSMNDSDWGYSTDAVPGRGVVYMGNSYATRNASFDEIFAIADVVDISGSTDVHFEKVTGTPNGARRITLTSNDGAEQQIELRIAGDGSVDLPQDEVAVCMHAYSNPQTKHVSQALWKHYEAEGARLGACESFSQSAVGTADTNGSGPSFSITDTTVTPDSEFDCSVTVLSTMDYPITLSFDIGGTPVEPFGSALDPIIANVSNAVNTNRSCGSHNGYDDINVSVAQFEKKRHWYSGESSGDWKVKRSIDTASAPSAVLLLQAGDSVPLLPMYSDALLPYIDFDADEMVMAANQVLYLVEMGGVDDWQDVIFLLHLE